MSAQRRQSAKVEADLATATDGTVFAIQSELVRGERRTYWLIRKERGTSSYVADAMYEDTKDKRTAHRMLKRRLAEYEEVRHALSGVGGRVIADEDIAAGDAVEVNPANGHVRRAL